MLIFLFYLILLDILIHLKFLGYHLFFFVENDILFDFYILNDNFELFLLMIIFHNLNALFYLREIENFEEIECILSCIVSFYLNHHQIKYYLFHFLVKLNLNF